MSQEFAPPFDEPVAVHDQRVTRLEHHLVTRTRSAVQPGSDQQGLLQRAEHGLPVCPNDQRRWVPPLQRTTLPVEGLIVPTMAVTTRFSIRLSKRWSREVRISFGVCPATA